MKKREYMRLSRRDGNTSNTTLLSFEERNKKKKSVV